MKKMAIFLFLILILQMPLTIHATNTKTPIEKLNEISDEALQMTKASRYTDASKLLHYFSEEFIRLDQRPYSMDEMRVVTLAHDEAVEATTSSTMDHSEIVGKVTKFRLVMDAVTSSHQPLWVQMEEPLLSAFAGVKEAVETGKPENFNQQLNSFLFLYQMVYPSMKLDIETTRMQELDTKIDYIDQFRPKVFESENSSQSELNEVERELKSIFSEMTEDEADPSLWWVIITTGSIILGTLSYVGWRKYKGETEQIRKHNRPES